MTCRTLALWTMGIAGLLAATTAVADAQTPTASPPPLTLTLEDALARAEQTSHRLGEARAREAVARATADGRRLAERPIVSAQAGYMRTNNVPEFSVPRPSGGFQVIYPNIPDNVRSRLDLQWPIYTGGRADALERAALAELAATGADREAARLDLRLEVTRVYWALVTAADTVRVVEQALARADAVRRDAQARADAGLVPPNELASADAQRARQEVLLIEARNQHAGLAIDLRRLTGLSADVPIVPEAVLDRAGDAQVSDAAPLISQALAQRPERQALQSRLEGAARRLDAAAASRRPVVSIGAGADLANPNPRIFPRKRAWQESWDASVNVSWLLWDSGRAAAERAEATAAMAVTRERMAETDSVIAADVQLRQLDLSSSRAATVAATAAVRSAEEARRVATDRFTAGVATTIDVLDAQQALLAAELERMRTLAGVRLAEARLARVLGR